VLRTSSIFILAALAVTGTASAAPTVRQGVEAWQKHDFTTAVAIWRPLAQQGDADAAFNLGQAYRLGRGVPTDLATAQRWLSQAATAGHTDAQSTLGLLLFDSGDRTGGVRWLRVAAEAGEPRALLVLGTALFNGDGVPKDPVLGYAYVSRAAAQGLAPAKITVAEMNKLMPVRQRQKGVALARNKVAAKSAAAETKASPHAATPVTKAATPLTGAWRIQLGAFSKRSSAQALYARVSSALGGRQAFYLPAGAVTRLQVGPYPSRAAAASACSALKGQACFPVPAK
jgi:TPR repeat protein